jgi:hypothetical protein
MPTWLVVLLVVIGVFVARAACFAYLWWRASVLKARQLQYLGDELTYAQVAERKREIVRLWRVAHVKQAGTMFYNPAPYGAYLPQQAQVWDNIFVKREDIQHNVHDFFLEAIGYFKDEVRRSLIPIFWPSVVFNFFGDVLVYIGVPPESVFVRVANVIGGLASFAAAIVTIYLAFV